MADVLALPSPEQFRETCRDLKLNDDQVRELGTVIYRSHMDLQAIFRAKIDADDRKMVMKQLKKVQTDLAGLLKLLKVSPREIANFDENLPFALGTQKGMIAASRVINTVAGRQVRKSPQVGRSTKMPFEVLTLCHQIVELKKGIDSVLGSAVTDRGGRNEDIARNHLALALGRSSQKIIDTPARSTAKGRFVKLVSDVFVLCGLSDEGVEKIVERTVKRLKELK